MSGPTRAHDHGCPYCNVRMDEGFVIDRTHDSKAVTQAWTEGEPEKSFWTGLKLKGKAVKSVRTWRCPRCGLLQSFAH